MKQNQSHQAHQKQKSSGPLVEQDNPILTPKSTGIAVILLQYGLFAIIAAYIQYLQVPQLIQNIIEHHEHQLYNQPRQMHMMNQQQQKVVEQQYWDEPKEVKPLLKTNREKFLKEQHASAQMKDDMESFNDEEFMRYYVCNPNHGYSVQILSHDPMVMKVGNFLAPGEAEHLRVLGTPLLARSRVAEKESVVSNVRTSFTAFLGRSEDPVVACIEKRASHMTNLPVENIEPLQVLRYQKGQQYEPHFDFFGNDTEGWEKQYERGGHRIITIFVYLNTVPEGMGGGTIFPELGMTVAAEKDAAAFWYDQDALGNMDKRTLHGGEMVTGDTEKWGLNIWIRERPFF